MTQNTTLDPQHITNEKDKIVLFLPLTMHTFIY